MLQCISHHVQAHCSLTIDGEGKFLGILESGLLESGLGILFTDKKLAPHWAENHNVCHGTLSGAGKSCKELGIDN